MEARTFVMGDIHGAHKAMLQCFERSGFNKEKDKLIQLGDVADGWPEVKKCVDELLSCKNLVAIKGNHDDWFNEFIGCGEYHPDNWRQGGEGTLRSYAIPVEKKVIPNMSGGYRASPPLSVKGDIPLEHRAFFKNQVFYFLDEDKNLFVHGGINRHYTLEENVSGDPAVLWWDRDLFNLSRGAENSGQKLKYKEEFKKIYIGHTQTTYFGQTTPMYVDRIINIDTGAGWDGVLTIMNVADGTYYQSDDVRTLYPDEKGRNR